MPDQPTVFDEDTGAYVHGAAVADVAATAGTTYTAAEQALINELRAKLNSVLAALRSRGVIAKD